MHALAVFPQQRKVQVITTRDPASPGPRQVRLRMREVGICGTDREIAAFVYGTAPKGAEHFILGHEALAEVAALGSEVEHLRAGDLVVPLVRLPCEHASCRPCRGGRPDFCATGNFRERGIKGADGFLVDSTLDEEANLVPVPAALAEVAVLIEPLTVVAKGMMQVRRFKSRFPSAPQYQRALVLGAGPVGLLTAMCAVASSYETVVYSREPSESERAEFVTRFGAQYASSQQVELPALAAKNGRFDVVIDATGHSPLAFDAIHALAPNGIQVFTGVPEGRPPVPIDIDRMMRSMVLQNQVLFGTVNAGPEDYIEAIHILEQLMALCPKSVRGLITGRFPLEEAPRLLAEHRGIKSVVTFDTH